MATRRATYERLASMVLVVCLCVLLVGDVIPLVAHHGGEHDVWWRILRIVLEVGLVIFYIRQVRRLTRTPDTPAPHQPGTQGDIQRPAS